MIYHEFLELLHTIVRQQSSAVLLAKTDKASKLAMDALGNAGEVYGACRDMIAIQADEANYAITSVIARLQKVYGRKAVQPDPVACDNIRLAIRQLRRLIEPQEVDTTPIDIFFV